MQKFLLYKKNIGMKLSNVGAAPMSIKSFLLFSARAKKERNRKWNDFLIYSQNVFERLAEYKAETPALPAIQSIVAEWQEIYLKTSIPVRMLC